MGGINESVIKSKKKNSASNPTVNENKKNDLQLVNESQQHQTIRQHISGGQIHFHDDDNKLKVSISIAEWHIVLRNLKNMNAYTYVDTEFNCMIIFKPFVTNDCFETYIEMIPITIGEGFKQLSSIVKTKF